MANERSAPDGLSRRDLIKYAAAAAAAAGAAKVVSDYGPSSLALFEPAHAAPRQDVPAGLSFQVDIPGCPAASTNIHSVSVGDVTVDVDETDCGQPWEYKTNTPVDVRCGAAALSCRPGKGSSELLEWLQDAAAGNSARKNVSVIVKDRAGSEVRRWNLMECFPVKYDPGDYSPSDCTNVETITVKVSRVEFA